MKSMARTVGAITALWTNSPELSNQLKEGLLERALARARSDENVQQLMPSQAIIAAPCKKKDVTAVISKRLDIVESPRTSDNKQIKTWALGGFDKLAGACRWILINPDKGSGLRKGAAEGMSHLARNDGMKKKLVGEETAMRTIIELGKSGAPNRMMYRVMATIVNLHHSYDKQETNPERLKLAEIRGECNKGKVKYGALRSGDNRDSGVGKAAAGALDKLTSANNLRYTKVFVEKQ